MKLSLLFSICLFTLSAYAQPFAREIREFEKQDSLQPPPAAANLFVGSSSVRMWKQMQKDFEGHLVINRGFGGSTLPDVIRYADKIIFPYHPAQVIIYCGENDLAAADSTRPETVAGRFQQLFGMIRSRWPQLPVVFIAIKPSPSRQHLVHKFIATNQLIREFLNTEPHTAYIDVFTPMLNEEGHPRKELFLEDMLHMNDKGYAIWKELVAPVLK